MRLHFDEILFFSQFFPLSWATNKDETLSFEMSECLNLSFRNMLNVKSKFFQEFDLVAFYFEIEEVHEFLKVGYACHYNAKKRGTQSVHNM